jgi:nucleoside-diphosphate-sugar epimerase
VHSACRGVDAIFHLAALPSVPKSMEQPIACTHNGLVATVNVLTAAKNEGVRRVVYSSSSSIYGGVAELPQKESATPFPKSPYAASKLCGETYAQTYSRAFDLDVISLRYFNVFGPRQSADSSYGAALPKFIIRMLSGEQPIIYGDGMQSRDFTFVDNVVNANLLAAECPERLGGEPVNIAAGHETTLLEIVDLINQCLGTTLDPIFKETRAGDVRHSWADLHRAGSILGYTPEISLLEGINRTIGYFQEQLKGLQLGA